MKAVEARERTVTTREAQHHLAKVLAMVDAGEEVVITRRGKKVARLERYVEPTPKRVQMPDFAALRRKLGTDGAGGENEVIRQRREGR